jgi:uncharacterized protein
MIKLAWACALLAVAATSTAQTATTSSPAKKALIAKVLKLQQPGFENLAQNMVEGPALQLAQQANIALQRRVPAEQRETVGKGLQTDLNKYVTETSPMVRERAVALGPTTVGQVLDEKFSEAELKQLVAQLESPINRKFSEHIGAMQRSLQEKLVAEVKVSVEAKLKTLEQDFAKRLNVDTADKPASTTPAK